MTREELEEALADARLYLSSDSPDAARAAVDMLHEAAAGFANDAKLTHDALTLVDLCSWNLVKANDASSAERALDLFFSIASRVDPEIAAIDPARLGTYRRGLLACGLSAMPARRAARHARLQVLFLTTQSLDGYVAECGCAAGLSFLQLCFEQVSQFPSWQGERFQVFDSFEGLSDPGQNDLDFTGMDPSNAKRVQAMTRARNMAFDYATVAQRIHDRFPHVELTQGWLPQSLSNMAEQQYRFVHVDVDLYEPTKGCFEYFYPRLVRGGVIVSDDYNWPGGRRAVDEFCEAWGLAPRLTATNQAYLIKA